MVIVGEFKLCLGTQSSVNNTSHLATSDDDIHIGIHGTLVVSGKDDTGIVVVGSAYAVYGLCFIVVIVPYSVDIHRDGTFDRLVRRSHHTIEICLCRLATTHTDGRIEARLDGNTEPLLAVRHGCFEVCNFFLGGQRIESTIIVETTEYLHRCGYSTIDGSVIGSVIIESLHLDAFTHLQVIVLAEDILIGSTARTGIFEGDILKSGVSPKWQTRVEVGDFDGATIVYIVIFTCNGCVTEKWRILSSFPHFVCQNRASVIICNIETICLVVGKSGITFSH